MTIGKKFAATSGLMVALSAVVGVVAVTSLGLISQKLNSVVNDSLAGTYLLGRIDGTQLDLRGATLHHVATSDRKMKESKDKQAAALVTQAASLFKEYEQTISTVRDRELFQPIPGFFDAYVQACEKVRTLSRDEKSKDAMTIYDTEGDATRKRLKDAINELIQYKRTSAAENAASATSLASQGRLWTFIILTFSLLAGASLAYVIIGGINRTLRQSIDQLHHGAAELQSASNQVSSASQSLAQGASEQAAAIEETSASTQEITTMTQQSAADSQSAAGMMEQTSQDVREANVTLDHMVTSMNDITSSAEKISKIIRVIDEIAFQTNILALNAAVEAARAGESGMGFAVVADEVRNLAQRSAQAAKDTAGLIEESITKSAQGRSRLDLVAQSVRRLTENTIKSKQLVDAVNAGSHQQHQGIQHISQAIAEMETVTQRTAAAAEESSSTSEELSAESDALTGVVASLRALIE
jgi:methyl-accepting chemotaxis protein